MKQLNLYLKALLFLSAATVLTSCVSRTKQSGPVFSGYQPPSSLSLLCLDEAGQDYPDRVSLDWYFRERGILKGELKRCRLILNCMELHAWAFGGPPGDPERLRALKRWNADCKTMSDAMKEANRGNDI